jgi:hypothetical protein
MHGIPRVPRVPRIPRIPQTTPQLMVTGVERFMSGEMALGQQDLSVSCASGATLICRRSLDVPAPIVSP